MLPAEQESASKLGSPSAAVRRPGAYGFETGVLHGLPKLLPDLLGSSWCRQRVILKKFPYHQDVQFRQQQAAAAPHNVERQPEAGPAINDPATECGFGNDFNHPGRVGHIVVRLAANDAFRFGRASGCLGATFHPHSKRHQTANIKRVDKGINGGNE